MISLRDRNRLTRAINKLVTAEVNASWARGGDPADWDYLEAQPAIQRKKLMKILNEITEAADAPPTRHHS